MTTHTSAYEQFVASMKITYEKWHDGDGYDLAALAALEGAEREEITQLLIDRSRTRPDWREIDALAMLGGTAALAALRAATHSSNAQVRIHAAEALGEGDESVGINAILHALRTARQTHDVSVALDAAAEHPTPEVRRAVLAMALNGADGVARVNAAALSLFLAGKASSPFDWDQRPFFLRFNAEDQTLLLEAWEALKQRVGPIPFEDAGPVGKGTDVDPVVRAIQNARDAQAVSAAFEAAAQHPTPDVQRAVLAMARHGFDGPTRVSAAGLSLYMAGQTSSPFASSEEPFFQRFGTDDQSLLAAAWEELKQRIGRIPGGYE